MLLLGAAVPLWLVLLRAAEYEAAEDEAAEYEAAEYEAAEYETAEYETAEYKAAAPGKVHPQCRAIRLPFSAV